MRILFLFIDGIGLGDADPETNPFTLAHTPTLDLLSNGKKWLRSTERQVSERAVFQPIDPNMGVAGRPQSGSNQATILTGLNIPSIIGRHYGPKPDEQTRNIINQDNFFIELKANGKKAALLDAYPPTLLANIKRGKTLPSSIQQAAISSGQDLFTIEDVINGTALTAEYTGEEWRTHLKLDSIPLYSPEAAGEKLVELALNYDFAFHSHWITDYVGHRGPMESAIKLLERIDGVLSGILQKWDDHQGLVVLTSDHGNMEKIGDRKHTENAVPLLVIGDAKEAFSETINDLSDLVPQMRHFLLETSPSKN
ncbi:metalloenzyme [Anaerolineales bacterium]